MSKLDNEWKVKKLLLIASYYFHAHLKWQQPDDLSECKNGVKQ